MWEWSQSYCFQEVFDNREIDKSPRHVHLTMYPIHLSPYAHHCIPAYIFLPSFPKPPTIILTIALSHLLSDSLYLLRPWLLNWIFFKVLFISPTAINLCFLLNIYKIQTPKVWITILLCLPNAISLEYSTLIYVKNWII